MLELWRDIKRTRNRYLSILMIVALGVGFFVGVKVTCPNMLITANQYFTEANLLDFRLMCNYGLTKEDVEATAAFEGVRQVEPGYSKDLFVGTGATYDVTAKVLSYNDGDINRLSVLDGRMPQHAGECVVENTPKTPDSFQIGETIRFSVPEDEEISDTLARDTYTIVGIIQSPNYIGLERGNTSIGDGSIDTVIFIHESDFTLDVYTDLYVTLEATQGLDGFSSAYDAIIDEYIDKFEAFGEARAMLRYDEVMTEAHEKLADARKELADGEAEANKELSDALQELTDAEIEIADAEQEIADAVTEIADGWVELRQEQADAEKEIADAEIKIADGEKELADAKIEIADGWQEYREGIAEFHAEISGAYKQLQDARAQLDASKKELDDGERQLLVGEQELKQTEAQLDAGFTQITAQRKQLQDAIDQMKDSIKDLEQTDPVYIQTMQMIAGYEAGFGMLDQKEAEIEAGYDMLETGKKELETARQEISSGRAALQQAEAEYAVAFAEYQYGADEAEAELLQARRDLEDAEETIAENEQKLADAKIELADARITLAKEIADAEQELRDAEQELADARIELEDAKIELADGWIEYEDGKKEAEEEILDAKRKLRDAEDDVRELENGKFYIFTRDDYPGHADYDTDAERVDNVAKVFPIFFILIAILVCLTNMTRMVDEQRTQLGTLKALGYTKGAIISKYLIYALSATILGCLLGYAIGFTIFPLVIFEAYRIMYTMPDIALPIHVDYVILCMLVACLATGGATFAVCRKELDLVPAQLMRPAAPKVGKKIWLEHIPAIWNRLGFIYKVTLRNIFRYKKRMLMTVVGISGCTALMLAGFGLGHAISSIVPRQFEEIFQYDGTVVLENDLLDEETDRILAEALSFDGVADAMLNYQMTVDAVGDSRISATVLVPRTDAVLEEYVSLRERTSKKPLTLDDSGAIINEKLAKRLGISAGDMLEAVKDGEYFSIPVAGVTENYTMNFIYMTESLYTDIFGGKAEFNIMLIHLSDGADETAIAEQLIATDNVLGLQFQSETSQKFKDLVDSLQYIVLVVIISAGLLAFIVLYNLVNVNVAERIREIATIKVLGFRSGETTSYITRETIVTTLMGIAVGLPIGVLLERFVVTVAEVEAVMFAPDIAAYCFLWSTLLTFGFSLIVNFTLHFQLKKIDMVESLKSVE